MTIVAYLLGMQGILGAWDTIYYHEWKARLPLQGRLVGSELKLHAYRDFVYALLFSTLPWLAWHGLWSVALVGLFLCEVVLTMRDFVVEDLCRKSLGGVYSGERVMHGVMGLVYGAMLGFASPVLWNWLHLPTSLVFEPVSTPVAYRWLLTLLAIGVILTGIRDLVAAYQLPGSAWPWHERR